VLYSRRGNRFGARFPALAKALAALRPGTILDGELVVLDKEGKPAFNALQNFKVLRDSVYFYAFDLLAFAGRDTRTLPLRQRRYLLEHDGVAGLSDLVRLSPAFEVPVDQLIRSAREQELEGIVAKRLDGIYETGQRTGSWVKYRASKGQELVIGGYMPGKYGFDSLLVGYYQSGKLMFIAKVRNGFVPALRLQVARKFKGLETTRCPFANLPEPPSARRGEALTPEVMKKCRWLKPLLVAQVEFTDWTEANHLRHARFKGLRDDKDASEVRKESP
jgi:bifunctional non-homologous end joining protein LigD